jgi:hypothetical protein
VSVSVFLLSGQGRAEQISKVVGGFIVRFIRSTVQFVVRRCSKDRFSFSKICS